MEPFLSTRIHTAAATVKIYLKLIRIDKNVNLTIVALPFGIFDLRLDHSNSGVVILSILTFQSYCSGNVEPPIQA
jgi:hypothetical protein